MKTTQLKALFTKLVGSGKIVRYGDLVKNGFHRAHIDHAASEIGIAYEVDKDGYTILIF